MKKRIITLVLLSLCLVSLLCSCAATSELLSESDANVKAYVDYMVTDDRDAMFGLLYPGVIERDDFDVVDEQMLEYCPVTQGYRLVREAFEVHTSFGSAKKTTVSARYMLSFDGKEYVILTELTESGDQKGFTVFRVITREEYEAKQ